MSKKSKAETMKVLVTLPVPNSYSRRSVVDYVRDAVHAHAGGFVEDAMIGESRKATARAYIEPPVATPMESAEAVPALTPVQVINTIVRDINSIPHLPPVSLRQNRREYWKAGARACLQALNGALHVSAQHLLGPGRARPTDSELFSYWVDEAARSPGRVAKALSHCATSDDYRAALWALVKEDEDKVLSGAGLLNPEGGIA